MKKKKAHKALIIIAIFFVAAAISVEAVRENEKRNQHSDSRKNCRCVRTIEDPENCTWECSPQNYSTKRTPPISENVPRKQNRYGAK